MTNDIIEQKERISLESASFELVQRRAKAYSESSLVPKEYHKNVPNCIIAMEIAHRVGASELMVMQNLYIVHGRPGWSSTYIIGAMNSCGRFKPLMFDIAGTGDDYGCVAWTEDKEGRRLSSSRITIGMAKKEGWYEKNGSKWKTMPEQMLRYRAASFLGRIYAPDILMGMQTVEELEDIIEPKDVTQTSKLSEVIAKKKEEDAAMTGVKEEDAAANEEVMKKLVEAVTEKYQNETVFSQMYQGYERELPAPMIADPAYDAALISISEAKTSDELDSLMRKIDFDAFPVEVQDNLQKASERKFMEFKK